MRDMLLVDAVIQMHEIARLVEQQVGLESAIAGKIRKLADELHVYSIEDDRANEVAKGIIKELK